VSETRNGVESDYVNDTLGSTIGLLNLAGSLTDRWEYCHMAKSSVAQG